MLRGWPMLRENLMIFNFHLTTPKSNSEKYTIIYKYINISVFILYEYIINFYTGICWYFIPRTFVVRKKINLEMILLNITINKQDKLSLLFKQNFLGQINKFVFTSNHNLLVLWNDYLLKLTSFFVLCLHADNNCL